MTIADTLALVISIISLLAVFYQTRSLKITLDNQIYESFISNSLEIDKILIQNPELRKYLYYGEEVNDDTPDLDRIMSAVEFLVDAVENIEVYQRYIPKSRRSGWLLFIKEIEETSAYKYYMKKHGKWFEVS